MNQLFKFCYVLYALDCEVLPKSRITPPRQELYPAPGCAYIEPYLPFCKGNVAWCIGAGLWEMSQLAGVRPYILHFRNHCEPKAR